MKVAYKAHAPRSTLRLQLFCLQIVACPNVCQVEERGQILGYILIVVVVWDVLNGRELDFASTFTLPIPC